MWQQQEAAQAQKDKEAGAAPKKRKGPERWGEQEENKGAGKGRLMWSLDYRLRTLEGKVPTYFLAEEDKLLVPAMTEAAQRYDSKLVKGQAHPDGPKRTTLAAAALNALALADLTKADQNTTAMITEFDKISALAHAPSVAEQQTILVTALASYTTAKKMEPEVSACVFYRTKKKGPDGKNKILFQLEFSDKSPLRHTVEFTRVCMSAIGATSLDGPPPPGPLIREVPRDNREK